MTEVFLNKHKAFTSLGIIAGICYAIFMIVIRVNCAFEPSPNQYGELRLVPFDLLLAMPAWLGFSKYVKQQSSSNWLIPFLYFIYAIVVIGISITLFLTNNALGNGLLLLLVLTPLSLFISIFLFFKILSIKIQ